MQFRTPNKFQISVSPKHSRRYVIERDHLDIMCDIVPVENEAVCVWHSKMQSTVRCNTPAFIIAHETVDWRNPDFQMMIKIIIINMIYD